MFGNLGARSGLCANNTVWNIHSIYDGSAAGIYVDGGSDITIKLTELHHSNIGIEIGAESKDQTATKMVVRKNYLFEANQLEHNDAKHTSGREISVSFASDSTIQRNVIKPNEQNVILVIDQVGDLKNNFDHQICHPNGKHSTDADLIFY